MSALELWTQQANILNQLFADAERGGGLKTSRHQLAPLVDVTESEDEFQFYVDLPGVIEKDIDVELNGNQLAISAKRERQLDQEQSTEQHKFHLSERSFGSFKRTFQLPEGVDAEKVKARYTNGVLNILVAKKPEVKPRKIDVLS